MYCCCGVSGHVTVNSVTVALKTSLRVAHRSLCYTLYAGSVRAYFSFFQERGPHIPHRRPHTGAGLVHFNAAAVLSTRGCQRPTRPSRPEVERVFSCVHEYEEGNLVLLVAKYHPLCRNVCARVLLRTPTPGACHYNTFLPPCSSGGVRKTCQEMLTRVFERADAINANANNPCTIFIRTHRNAMASLVLLPSAAERLPFPFRALAQ